MDFRSLNIASIILRFLMSIAIGGVLGMERGRKNRPAGFRTYMLVCMGAALVMMTNQYAFQFFNVSDPVRMGAQVVSGIGFLGAGTIMVTGRNQIKGITTAAGLWTAACCGLAIGVGFYEGAIVGGAAVFIIMASMQRFDQYIRQHAKEMELYVEMDSKERFGNFLEYIKEHDLEISDLQVQKNKMLKDSSSSIFMTVRSKVKIKHIDVIDLMSNAPGVLYIEELN